MKFTFQLLICVGIPLTGISLYNKLFSKVEDNIVFQIGFVNTIDVPIKLKSSKATPVL